MHHGGDDDPRTTGESGVARSHLDEPDAAQRLGIDPASLETYVSYGWVRRYVTTDGRYLYDRSDIDRVLSHAARHAATPADGMALGEVAEEIGITTLDPFGPIYRGYRAIELIDQGIPFEGVAELLWAGSTPRAAWWPMTADIPRALQGRVGEGLTESALFRLVLTELAIADRHPNAMHAKDDLERARILLPALAGSMALMDPRIELKAVLRTRRVAERAALALGADRVAELLVNRALVLTADHEVAASTFAARVAATSGADLYACLAAALSICTRQEITCALVEQFVTSIGGPNWAEQAVATRLDLGQQVPGFDDPLYPDGDPRGPPLLDGARVLDPASPILQTMQAVVDAMARRGSAPTLEFGLVAVASACRMRAGAATALFLLGRLAGFVAHVIEQRDASGSWSQ